VPAPTYPASADLAEGTGTRSFAAVTTQPGDWLVVEVVSESDDTLFVVTPSATGLTFTQQTDSTTTTPGAHTLARQHTAYDGTGGSRTVTMTPGGTFNYRARVTVVRGSAGPGTGKGASKTAQTISITRQQDHSGIFYAAGDWSNAGTIGTPTWTPGGTTTAAQDGTAADYAFGRWDDSGPAGTAAHGVATPTLSIPSIAVLEMLGSPDPVSPQWTPGFMVAMTGLPASLRAGFRTPDRWLPQPYDTPPTPSPIREWLSNEGSAVNISVTTSSATAAGDTILVFHSNDFNIAANLTGPTTGTWNLEATGDSGNTTVTSVGSHTKLWSGSATGGAQTITVAPTNQGEEHGLIVVVFRGTYTADAKLGDGSQTTTTTFNAPSISPTNSGDTFITCASGDGNAVHTTALTVALPQTRQAFVNDPTFGFIMAAGSETLAASGPTGTRQWTIAPTSHWSVISVAMTPGTGATGTNADADAAAAIGYTAFDAAIDVQVNAAAEATVAYSAFDAVAAAGPTADAPAAIGWTGYDASTALGVNAAAAAALGYVAFDATAAAGVNAAAEATVGYAAYDATVQIGIAAPGDVSTQTWTAYDAAAAVTVNADVATPTWTAFDAVTAAGVNADTVATVGFTAYDATVSTQAITNAPADAAAPITYTANDATPAVGVNTDAAAPLGYTGYDAATAAGIQAGVATPAWTAFDANTAAGINAGISSPAWSAFDATPAVGVNADAVATIGFQAFDATVSTVAITQAPADVSSLAYTAQDATIAVQVAADVAQLAYAAFDAALAAGIPGNAAATTGYAAFDATVQTGRAAAADAAATVGYAAADATIAVRANAAAATVGYAAYDATVLAVSQVKPFVDVDSTAAATGGPDGSTGSTEPDAAASIGGQLTAAATASGEPWSAASSVGGQG
jgi:hypothetical protein